MTFARLGIFFAAKIHLNPTLVAENGLACLHFVENWTIRIHGFFWMQWGSPWCLEMFGSIMGDCVENKRKHGSCKKMCFFCEGKLVLLQESGGYKPPIFTRICSFPTTHTDQTYTCWCLKILKGSPTILCNNLDPLLGGSFEIMDILPLVTMDREHDPISKLGLQLRLMHDWFERNHRISLAEDCSCTYTIEWHGIHKRESTTNYLCKNTSSPTPTHTHTHSFNTSPKCKSHVPKYLDRRQLIHKI